MLNNEAAASNSPVEDVQNQKSPREDDVSDKEGASPPASAPAVANGKDDDDDDDESDILSELDEDQVEDYDPATANIEDRPVDIDEDVARTLKVSRRKAVDGERKKPREGRREKRRHDDGADGAAAAAADGDGTERPRKRRGAATGAAGGGERKQRSPSPPDQHLTVEERRSRALQRQLEAAVKAPQKRRRRKAEDLDDAIDDQIAELVHRMEEACQADNVARDAGESASRKVAMIDEVVGMMNRNTAQDAVLDPESQFLRAVKFFLEPLSDGSLPAYDVQNKIFVQLTRLPIGKEQLRGSELGKVVFFYTKSKNPMPHIKRMANKLVEDWSRPILKRTNDYKKRQIESRDYDYTAAKLSQQRGSQFPLSQRSGGPSQAELDRERALATPSHLSLARAPGLPASYSIAPKSNLSSRPAGMSHRPLGASGIDAFRRMTQKPKKR